MSYLIMQNGEIHRVTEELPPIDCFRCGICCVRYRPKVGDGEIDNIARKLGVSRRSFLKSYIHILPKSRECILDNGGNRCPFLRWPGKSEYAKCIIHSFRPQACRNWTASLSRAECQEGLSKLKQEKGIIKPRDMYSSQQEIDEFNRIITQTSEKKQAF